MTSYKAARRAGKVQLKGWIDTLEATARERGVTLSTLFGMARGPAANEELSTTLQTPRFEPSHLVMA